MVSIIKKIFIATLVFIAIVVVFIVAHSIYYWYHPNPLDDMSKQLGRCFESKNINMFDSYFSKDTEFVCKGKNLSYDEVRNNLIKVLENKEVNIYGSTSSLGGREMNTECMYIVCRIKIENLGGTDFFATLKYDSTFFNNKVIELSSNERLFEYLFFDSTIDIIKECKSGEITYEGIE